MPRNKHDVRASSTHLTTVGHARERTRRRVEEQAFAVVA
jgi:hypothetical protein